jgi:hypothetical protein
MAVFVAAAVTAPFTHGYSLFLIVPAAILVGISLGSR